MAKASAIRNVPLDSITPYELNPRQNAAAVDAVAASIEEFGFLQPIVVDAHNVIIVGHVRYAAAANLGLAKVPVLVAEHLTEEQVAAYRLIDNSSGEIAKWDFSLLAGEVERGGGTDALQRFGFDASFLTALSDEVMAIPSIAGKGARGSVSLVFGRYRAPMTDSEFGALAAAYEAHMEARGSAFGFVASIMGTGQEAS